MLIFERIHPDSVIPTKGSLRSACYDLYASEDGKVYFGGISIFSTGIKMAIPDGYMGHIVPRSGLAAKYGIQVLAGIIDSDYRGEVKIVLTTALNGEPYIINKGDRIAQLLIVANPRLMSTESQVLEDTERGSGGFGSTGK